MRNGDDKRVMRDLSTKMGFEYELVRANGHHIWRVMFPNEKPFIISLSSSPKNDITKRVERDIVRLRKGMNNV